MNALRPMPLHFCYLIFNNLSVATVASQKLEYSFTAPMIWRGDNRCGADFPLHNGKISECNPDGEFHCCNSTSHCGKTSDDCECDNCIDYKGKIIKVYSRFE